ncbi:uncharacterized protein RCC_04214 [Ramularia collo-cygni]|uniref:RING-type domain-containing protein n=1 Tax=Ramularia collo-cygni TaxID=112498 RepID=A0A2D3UYT8_9PEZI|nr:uncharacterized protein RCC_04214 [Ramularia collo-cygni]CZT18370.1 uncharacterized protein RCC_04214 [Ramularia collo-cygni]
MPSDMLIRTKMEEEDCLLPTCPTFMISGVTTFASHHESCSICCHELTSAIRIIRCGHYFDRECLASWFASRTRPNTCPMCREELFQKYDELGAVLEIFDGIDFEFDTFDIPGAMQAQIPQIARTNGNLLLSVLSIPNEAMTRIDCRMASSALALAGNTAITVAKVQGFPLNEIEMMDYRYIVKAVYTFLESMDGEEMQVNTMPMEILLGASRVMDNEGWEVDIDSIWPNDIVDLEDDPARRAVQLAFFVTWILWHNIDAVEEAYEGGVED